MTAKTYTPHDGPITLDTLDDLFASRREMFAGFSMKEGDDAEEEIDDPADEEGADDEGDDGEDEEYVAPTKEEWAKTTALLTKANAEAKRRRLAAKEVAAKAKKKSADDDEGDDDDEQERRDAETETKWKGRVVKSSAKAALATAGAEKPERLLRLVDVDSLDVDDDGEVEGLDDEIDRLKEEYPELFKRRRGGRVETGDRSDGKDGKKAKTATERQAAAILGNN